MVVENYKLQQVVTMALNPLPYAKQKLNRSFVLVAECFSQELLVM